MVKTRAMEECNICLEDKRLLPAPCTESKQYTCSHRICEDCWRQSTEVNYTCPYCREEVSLFLGKHKILTPVKQTYCDNVAPVTFEIDREELTSIISRRVLHYLRDNDMVVFR